MARNKYSPFLLDLDLTYKAVAYPGLRFKDFSECFGTERLTKSYTRLGSLYQLDSQLDPVQFLHFSAHNGAKVLFRKIFGT